MRMGRKRLKFKGFIDVPGGFTLPELGSIVEFKGKGEVTGDGDELKRKSSGEKEIVVTNTITIDSDATQLTKVSDPQGPLDEALAGAAART
jgi:hypothetical protein